MRSPEIKDGLTQLSVSGALSSEAGRSEFWISYNCTIHCVRVSSIPGTSGLDDLSRCHFSQAVRSRDPNPTLF